MNHKIQAVDAASYANLLVLLSGHPGGRIESPRRLSVVVSGLEAGTRQRLLAEGFAVQEDPDSWLVTDPG